MKDELIERALRGEATPEELDALRVWRRSSAEHDDHVTRLKRLLAGVQGLRAELYAAPPPTAAEVLHGSSSSTPTGA